MRWMLSLLVLIGAPVASAQHARPETDWLVALPLCAMGDPASTEPSLVYPAPGFPALVRPGHTLVTRVRVPVPLTPPPGHQQEKALRGWSVELVGHALVLGGEHRYALRVSDVRIDGAEGFVLRASVPIPEWVAPGTYDLRLQSPGAGWLRAVASVRVFRGEPRVAALPENVRALGAYQARAVDVWIGPSAPSEALRRPAPGEGIPWLARDLPGALLRAGERAYRVGGCDDPAVPFEARSAAFGPLPAPGDAREGALQLNEGGVSIRGDHEFSLVFGEDEGGIELPPSAELVGVWPASSPSRAGHRPSVLMRVRADQDVVLSRVGGTNDDAQLSIDPVRAGDEASLRLRWPRAARRFVALSWQEDGGAFRESSAATDALSLRFSYVERQVVQVWWADAQGRVRRQALATQVRTDRPGGCGASGSSGTAFFGLLLLAWYGRNKVRPSVC